MNLPADPPAAGPHARRRLTDTRPWLRVEAWLYLHAARLAVRLIPFRRLTGFFEKPAARPEQTGAVRDQLIRDVRWAIWATARHQPERLVCFPRAVAAQVMLRRRGVSTSLYYGAATATEKGLSAHVWVQDGDLGVIGTRSNTGYKTLARYGPPTAARPS